MLSFTVGAGFACPNASTIQRLSPWNAFLNVFGRATPAPTVDAFSKQLIQNHTENSFLFTIQLVYQISTSYLSQFIDNGTPFFGFVPEEEHSLRQLLFL